MPYHCSRIQVFFNMTAVKRMKGCFQNTLIPNEKRKTTPKKALNSRKVSTTAGPQKRASERKT